LNVALGAEERLTGTIQAPTLSIAGLVAPALGATRVAPGQGPWASARFPAYVAPKLPISVRLAAPFADLGGGVTGRDAKLTLELDERGLAITDGAAELAGGELKGEWRIARDGGLARSALHLSANGIDLKRLMQASSFAGKLSGRLEVAGAGETFAQIVASSGGNGTLHLSEGTLEQALIAGVRRGFTRALADDNLMDKTRLATAVEAETARGALSGINFEAPLVVTNGVARTTIPRLDLPGGDGADATAGLDLKTLTLDAHLGFSTLAADRPDNPVPLAAALTWKGPLFAPRREADVAALLQSVSVERLRIELERIELMEYDQREQAMFNRRLKAGRQKALPLPPPPEPAMPPVSPAATSGAAATPGAPAAEGEAAAKEPAAQPSVPAPLSPGDEPASPAPPLIRAPQPPARPPQAPEPETQPALKTNSGKADPILIPSIEQPPVPASQLAPLPPPITVAPAPSVAGAPAVVSPLRPNAPARPPIVLHPPD
jgi:hypothetical protein